MKNKFRILKRWLSISMIFVILVGITPILPVKANEEMVIVYSNLISGGVEPGTQIYLSSSDVSGQIYYTLDGSEPTTKSQLYTDANPIVIEQNTVIKAISVNGNDISMVWDYRYSVDNQYEENIYYYLEDGLFTLSLGTTWEVVDYDSGDERPQGEYDQRYLRSRYYDNSERDEGLSLVQYDSLIIPSEGNPALSFYMYQSDSNAESQDLLSIFVDDGTDCRDITSFMLERYSDKPGWKKLYIDLSSFRGKSITMEIIAQFQQDETGDKNREIKIDELALVNMKLAPVDQSALNERLFDDTELPKLYSESGKGYSDLVIMGGEVLHRRDFMDVETIGNNNCSVTEDMLGNTCQFIAHVPNTNLYSASLNLWLPIRECYPVTFEYIDKYTYTMKTKSKDAKIVYSIDYSTDEILYDGEEITFEPGSTIFSYATKDGFASSEPTTFVIPYEYTDDVVADVGDEKPVTAGTMIQLSNASDLDIYYTMDGTTPTLERGIRYEGPITINQSVCLSAATAKDGIITGKICTFTYEVIEKDMFEPNNRLSSATMVSLPAKFHATLNDKNDVDCYGFQIDNSARVLTRLIPDTDYYGDFTVEIRNQKGTVLNRNVAKLNTGIYTDLPKGTYYVRICGNAGGYTLNMGYAMEPVVVDLSEMNLLTTTFHSQSPYSYDKALNMNNGAFNVQALASFAGWRGIVSEEDDPYIELMNDNIPDETVMKYKNPAQQYHLQNAIFLPSRNSIGDKHNNDAIKSALMTYGAIEISYCTNEYYSWDNKYFYNPNSVDWVNHSVLLVGYDDTIAKENFITYDGKMPEQDGAFICRNSWGTEFGENGYFYISYESGGISEEINPTVYIADESTDNYDTIYQYDILGFTETIRSDENEIYAKNVFTAAEDEVLKAVSFYCSNSNDINDIYIKIGDGDEKYVASVQKEYAGYYTQRIPEFELTAGMEFSVIIRTRTTDGECPEICVEAPISYYSGNAVADCGQSFVSKNGYDWIDISDRFGTNCCIKAFTIHGTETEGVKYQGEQRILLSKNDISSLRLLDGLNYGTLNENVMGNVDDGRTESADEKKGYGANTSMLKPMKSGKTSAIGELPERFDLRELGCVNSGRDQGMIGSCWTFGAIGSVESGIMMNGNQKYSYPKSVVLIGGSSEMYLDEQTQYTISADVIGDNIGNRDIYYSFSGDLDSIKIQNSRSNSGEEIVLFQAIKEGTVTITAKSAADEQRSAAITVVIKNSREIVEDEKSTQDDSPWESHSQETVSGEKAAQTGDDYTYLCLVMGLALSSMYICGKSIKKM